MATKILTTLKQNVAGLELEPSSGGCFEVTVDGQLVFSKLKTGEFPDEEALVKKLEKRVK